MDKKITLLIMLTAISMIPSLEISKLHAEYPLLISEDKIWECEYWRRNYYMKFSGVEEHGGVMYNVLRVFAITDIDGKPVVDDFYKFDENGMIKQALMREEDGKVYVYFDDACLGIGDPEEPECGLNKEMLMYDMNCTAGDTYRGCIFYHADYLEEHIFSVVSESTVAVGSEDRKCINVVASTMPELYPESSTTPIVEGVGLTRWGCLFYADGYWNITGLHAYYKFTRLFDLEGNILYMDDEYYKNWPIPDFPDFSSVKSLDPTSYNIEIQNNTICIENSNDIVSIELYDVNGVKYKSVTSSGDISVDVRDVPNGIYILKISADGKTTHKKIMLSH